MRVDEASPPPAAADRCHRHSFLGIKSTYAGVLREMPKEALPTGARTARILLALCWLPIRPTPRKLRCSCIALLFSASFISVAEFARFSIFQEAGHDSLVSAATFLTLELPFLPGFYVVICANVLLVKGCILHRLIIESPSPSHMHFIATLGLAASVCCCAFILGYGVYIDGREAADLADSADPGRDLRLAAVYKSVAISVADALIGKRVMTHQIGFSVLWMSESSRVLVDTVARFEAEFLAVLDAENVGRPPTEIYEQLHECELRLRVNFKLVNTHLAPGFALLLGVQVYGFLLCVINALRDPGSQVVWIGLAVAFLLWLVYSCATLARPSERWLQMLRDIDTPRTLLVLQQRLQMSLPANNGLGPVPDIMNHLYRNPAGVRMSGTLLTQALVVRVALAAVLPLLLLLLNAAAREGDALADVAS